MSSMTSRPVTCLQRSKVEAGASEGHEELWRWSWSCCEPRVRQGSKVHRCSQEAADAQLGRVPMCYCTYGATSGGSLALDGQACS